MACNDHNKLPIYIRITLIVCNEIIKSGSIRSQNNRTVKSSPECMQISASWWNGFEVKTSLQTLKSGFRV